MAVVLFAAIVRSWEAKGEGERPIPYAGRVETDDPEQVSRALPPRLA